jgi:hypothetical protein
MEDGNPDLGRPGSRILLDEPDRTAPSDRNDPRADPKTMAFRSFDETALDQDCMPDRIVVALDRNALVELEVPNSLRSRIAPFVQDLGNELPSPDDEIAKPFPSHNRIDRPRIEELEDHRNLLLRIIGEASSSPAPEGQEMGQIVAKRGMEPSPPSPIPFVPEPAEEVLDLLGLPLQFLARSRNGNRRGLDREHRCDLLDRNVGKVPDDQFPFQTRIDSSRLHSQAIELIILVHTIIPLRPEGDGPLDPLLDRSEVRRLEVRRAGWRSLLRRLAEEFRRKVEERGRKIRIRAFRDWTSWNRASWRSGR